MKRMLAISFALVLILAACVGSDSEPTSTPQASESTATPTESTPSPTEEVMSSSEFDVIEFIVSGDRAAGEPQDGSEAGSTSTPDATIPTPDATTPTPDGVVETPSPGEQPANAFPSFPAVPDVVTCQQAVDLWMLNLQIWLDGLANVPVEVVRDGAESPPGFDAYIERIGEQMTEIEERATQLGCEAEQLEMQLLARVDDLIANNPAAEWVMRALRAEAKSTQPDPTPTSELPPVEVEWTITTCADAADVFIERTQILVLDSLAGKTIADMEALGEDELPESFMRYIQEMRQMRTGFLTIGCTEAEVTALIGERVDQLVPQGEAAEDLIASLREAVADNELFVDLD